jgi:hypothetical protein
VYRVGTLMWPPAALSVSAIGCDDGTDAPIGNFCLLFAVERYLPGCPAADLSVLCPVDGDVCEQRCHVHPACGQADGQLTGPRFGGVGSAELPGYRRSATRSILEHAMASDRQQAGVEQFFGDALRSKLAGQAGLDDFANRDYGRGRVSVGQRSRTADADVGELALDSAFFRSVI